MSDQEQKWILALTRCIRDGQKHRRRFRRRLSWHPEFLAEWIGSGRVLLIMMYPPPYALANDFYVIWAGMKQRGLGEYAEAFDESLALLRSVGERLPYLETKDDRA